MMSQAFCLRMTFLIFDEAHEIADVASDHLRSIPEFLVIGNISSSTL